MGSVPCSSSPALPPGFSTRSLEEPALFRRGVVEDRKSTRLNSSHGYISYAVFCLKKKTTLATRVIVATGKVPRCTSIVALPYGPAILEKANHNVPAHLVPHSSTVYVRYQDLNDVT